MVSKVFLDLIYHGSEERNLEYKSSMNWGNSSTKSKITKSAIAMANIKDGGVIVLGIEEKKNGIFKVVGMKLRDFTSFNQDDVQDYVNGYADPYVELKVNHVEHEKKKFVIIEIQEFSGIPIICKESGVERLVRGGLYTRPRRKYESVLVPSQTEMREIIDLAVDKNVRKYREKLFKWELIQPPKPPEKINEGKFAKQRGGL